MYDPTLGRFLSADPIVPYPDASQSLNRYSYVHNNPLSFTDPSGHFPNPFKAVGKFVKSFVKGIGRLFKNPYVRLAVGIAAGFYGGQAIALRALGAAAKGSLSFHVVAGASGGFIAGAIIGGTPEAAFYGGLSGGFAGLIGHYGTALGSLKPLAHGLSQGLTTRLQGGSFQTGLLSGVFTSAAQGTIGGIRTPNGFLNFAARTTASAVVGGTAAVIGGGKFANGAKTGAFVYAFNEAMHDSNERDPQRVATAEDTGNAIDVVVDAPLEGVYPEALLPVGRLVSWVGRGIGWAGRSLGFGGTAAKEALTVSFGHGARHLAGTGVSQGTVEAAIGTQVQTVGRAAGGYWGRVSVQGTTIEYRAYPLANGGTHVGTYYPVRP